MKNRNRFIQNEKKYIKQKGTLLRECLCQEDTKEMLYLTREINFKIKKEHPDTQFVCRGTRQSTGYEKYVTFDARN